MRRTCYSFENSGHRFEPLDRLIDVAMRLYCTRCGRVITASSDNNTADWDFSILPPEAQNEWMMNAAGLVRGRSDA